MNRYVFLSIMLLVSFLAIGQPKHYVVEYTSKDGLSQNTVMDILQDKKGFMWFATWDGLCKFDGYSFNTYKVRPGDSIRMSNSRIDKIVEDSLGYIWCLTYGLDVFRFDPVNERFSNVPSLEPTFPDYSRSIIDIQCLSDGTVWLFTENEGVFRVQSKEGSSDIALLHYSVKTGLLEGDVVYKIFVDKENTQWILTDNGLAQLKKNSKEPVAFFFENDKNQKVEKQSFFAYHQEVGEVLFGSIHGRVWRYEKKGERFSLLQLPTQSNVRSIHKLNEKYYFFSTFQDGFFVYNMDSDQFEHFSTRTTPDLPSDTILETYLAKNGEVWIQQNKHGVTQFIPPTKKITFHPVPYENVEFNYAKRDFFMLEDVNGHLWIYPYGGFFSYYNSVEEKVIPFQPNNVYSPPLSRQLHSLYSDRQGNLWMCSRTKGLKKITFSDDAFQLIKPFVQGDEMAQNEVRALMKDHQNNLWVFSRNGGLVVYDQQLNYIGYLNRDGNIGNSGSPFEGAVYCMELDENGDVWIGTKGNGLYKLKPKESGYSFEIENFIYDKDDLYSISNNNIYHIYIDSKKRVWVATFGGGINLVSETDSGICQFINHRNNLNGFPINSCFRVRYITSDYNQNICIGTTNGLLVFNEDFVEPESISFTRYSFQAGDSSCLSNNDVHFIQVNKKRETYLATFGGGLNKIISNSGGDIKFQSFTRQEGLPSDVLLAMLEDEHGNLWISTENGLSKFNLPEKSFENFSETELGVPLLFSEATVTKDSDGFFYFGSNKGVLRFHPDSIRKNSQLPTVVFTRLMLFNKVISPGDRTTKFSKNIDNMDELVLRHNENVFSIGFAALEMKNPQNVQYAYMLDGFEKQWNYVLDKRVASYTNLSPGNYVLMVKSSNGEGVWGENTRQLRIRILPSFWQTSWGYIIYLGVIVVIVFLVFKVFFTIYSLKNEVRVENQLTEMKLSFFTDISHELRTPLTLITGPVEQVLQDESLSLESREQIKLVERNAGRMLKLISQLLDFAKLRNKKMKLRVREIELVGFLRQIMDDFRIMASHKGIEFELVHDKEAISIWADDDKLEKIFFNLLSNAFKYLKEGKSISVMIEESIREVVIKVCDTGIGIEVKKQASVFNRFENWVSNASVPSSGIGLSLVKELVDLHKGKVTFVSQEGIGTEFSVTLQKGLNHFDDEAEIIVNESLDELKSDWDIEVMADDVAEDDKDTNEVQGNKTSILLVEDNTEVRLFLKKLLKKNYYVTEAVDGDEAIHMVTELLPDLIISDLMMPRVDGIEFLQYVRRNINTSHIPFIILSAKSTLDNQLEGLGKGADVYVTKPFSTSYLLGTVKNLLERREKLHEYYQGTGENKKLEIEPAKVQVSSLDKEFVETLMGIMEKNMDNGSLVVDDLVSEMAVSRSVFFKKLKSLTGMAPIEFIKEVRLKRAAQLIEESQYNITQIAYMVGINDSRYFSKCFKIRFGHTPTKYREQFNIS